jgi:predicted RNA polymerase sigma factor
MVHGPDAGLALTDTVADALSGNHRLDAVRAHLHDMAGDPTTAITYYTAAARRTTSTPERDYLLLRAARLRENPPYPDTTTARSRPSTHTAP